MPLIFWVLGGLGVGAGAYRLGDEAGKLLKFVVIGGVIYVIYKSKKG